MTAHYTPMIQQYLRIKAQYHDAFLFFRLGDFYELFFDDAVKAAQELEITLTKRDGGSNQPVPMCGVPHHSADHYIARLIDKGYKVAICEQMEDPKQAKGVVKREVTQLITPGTIMDSTKIDAKQNNYIAAISPFCDQTIAVAFCDLTTGESRCTKITGGWESAHQEILASEARELVIPSSIYNEIEQRAQNHFTLSIEDETKIPEAFSSIVADVIEDKLLVVLGRLFNYLTRTQKRALDHLQPVTVYERDTFLKMDLSSKKNLELLSVMRGGRKKGSLLWLLDKTVTAMGGRLLKQWLDRPLVEQKMIEKRLDMLECLHNNFFVRETLREQLREVYDLERLAGKISFGSANPRDLLQLKQSLEQIPHIVHTIKQLESEDFDHFISNVPSFTKMTRKLADALLDDPAVTLKEGGIIRPGYSKELDDYRDIQTNGKDWLKQLEQAEKKETGIKSLKIGYNKVFGYYIEVTKANLHLLPEGRYERKQTLANAERYVTAELKEMEAKILQAEEKIIDLEYELFVQLREEVKNDIPALQLLAKKISEIDVLQSLAQVSEEQHYTRPAFNPTEIAIKNGRHPVVEKVLTDSQYVENDIHMDENKQILLITGPNMSGKSTYMRQLAQTAVMAQIGCFVPADEAVLPIFDQVFTRIGASDDLIAGQSTFMVEMLETNHALANATANSLILLDEIGRGTSTYDGMALAQSIIEHIHDHIGAKTLFSTHYHELTALEHQLPRLHNVHVQAIEEDERIVFLHKVQDGAADKSYGIQVAQLAELPESVIARAQTILNQLEEEMTILPTKQTDRKTAAHGEQLSFFAVDYDSETNQHHQEKQVCREIADMDILDMTPLEALNTLYQLQKRIKTRSNEVKTWRKSSN